MNPFAGIVMLDGAAVGSRQQESLVAIMTRRSGGRPLAQSSAHALFVQDGAAFAPDGRRRLFAADARLDNGAEIAAALRLDAKASDATLICHAFERQGDAGIAPLLGAFAFAHWDEPARRLTLARDCLGRRPLFFHRGDGFVCFASFLPDLLAMPDVPRRIDAAMMASFLTLDHRERERTFYLGIDRVPSRSCVSITADGVSMRRYWSPRLDAPPPFKRDEDTIERARELFDRAMARCLRDTPRVAILTSGGFDSSAVAATAARLGHGDVTCYTGLPPDGFDIELPAGRYLDERPKVEALARLHPSLRMRFIAPAGVHPLQDDGARLFVRLGLPTRAAGNMGWFGFIDEAIAADGHRIVLGGAMGNYGLTWAGGFSLAALARERRYAALLREAQAIARVEKRKLWRVIAGELGLRLAPRAVQRLVTRLRGEDPDSIDRFSLLNPDAIVALDLHRRWKDDGFDPWYRQFGSPTRLRAHQLFDQLQVGRDVGAMYQAVSGHEMRDPHADRELLEFCLAVPEWLYRRNGISRWFARQVFADRLPPEILNETGRGAQAPNWFASLNARKPAVAAEIERIEASPLAGRLIDVARLKRLYSEWPQDAHVAETRRREYGLGLDRAIHVGQFIRWVEGGNA